MSERRFIYDEDYPYFQVTLGKSGSFSYDVRVAVRDYVRVFFPLELYPGKRLLDVGSNIGTLGHYLSYAGVYTLGVDLNLAAIKAGRKLYGNEPNNISLVADGRNLPFPDGSFNAVVSQDVFEHLPDEQSAAQMLKEMSRVITGKNSRMLHKITVLEDEANIHGDDSHYLKWTTQQWSDFFASNGWCI